MADGDVAVAWWVFWLIAGLVIVCGLIWGCYRLAWWSDRVAAREPASMPEPEPGPEAADRGAVGG